MIKVLLCRFHQFLGRFDMFTVEGCSEARDPNIPLTISLTVYFVENTLAMNVIFFSKCTKFDEDLKNEEKNQENIFTFLDNCV